MALALPWLRRKCDWCEAPLEKDHVKVEGRHFCSEDEVPKYAMRLRRRAKDCGKGCH